MLPLDKDHMKISALDEADLLKIRERIQEELTGDTKRFRIPAEREILHLFFIRLEMLLKPLLKKMM